MFRHHLVQNIKLFNILFCDIHLKFQNFDLTEKTTVIVTRSLCSLYPAPGVIFTQSLTSNINSTLETAVILIKFNYYSRLKYPRVLSSQPMVLISRLWPNFQFV